MVKNKTEYDENLIKINEPIIMMRKLRNMQKSMAKLQTQIELHQKNTIMQTVDYVTIMV